MKLWTACNVFQCDPQYASQTSMPIECRIQYLFIAVIYCTCTLSIILLLTVNWIAYHKDLEETIHSWEEVLLPKLLNQLKRVMWYHNPLKSKGHITVDQPKQLCACCNHVSISKNLSMVKKTMIKEERSKHAISLPWSLECFLLDSCLTPQGFAWKQSKSYHLVFDCSMLETSFSVHANKQDSAKDKIELYWGLAMTRNLFYTHNIQILCINKHILIFDKNASGPFSHAKFYSQTAAAQYTPSLMLVVNISSKNVVFFKPSPDADSISVNHKKLTKLVKIPPDVEKFPHVFVQVTKYYAKRGIFASGKLVTNKTTCCRWKLTLRNQEVPPTCPSM